MKIVPAHDDDKQIVSRSGTFTGTVWGDPVSDQDDVALNTVYFSPGARTHWHTHPGGQALHVTSGSGWVASRGEKAKPIRSGDIVWASPGEEHWHGADEDNFLVHLAVSLGKTDWRGQVTDEDYADRESGS